MFNWRRARLWMMEQKDLQSFHRFFGQYGQQWSLLERQLDIKAIGKMKRVRGGERCSGDQVPPPEYMLNFHHEWWHSRRRLAMKWDERQCCSGP